MITNPQRGRERLVVPKTDLNGAKITVEICAKEQTVKDRTNHLLVNSPSEKRLIRERKLNEWNNWESASTLKQSVLPKVLPLRRKPIMYAIKERVPISRPSVKISSAEFLGKSPSFFLIGGLFIASFAVFSSPREIAGNESVTRLTQRSWMAASGEDSPRIIAANTVIISPMLQDKRKCTALFMLS